MPERLDVVRVFPDERAFEFLHRLGNRQLAMFERRFADTVEPASRQNFDKDPVCPIGMADMRLNGCNCS